MSTTGHAVSPAYFAAGELVPGTKLRVERTLGRGGQGEVHLVVNEVSRQRQVMKLLHPELVRSESAMARFVKEVQLMAMLTHPHIVKLLHTDVSAAEGTRPALPYLLMEHLDGESLADVLAGPTSMRWDTTVRLFAEVAEALGYASTKVGLVHRDLKPANLFVARNADGEAFAKVLDFGISQLCEALTSVTSDDFLGTEHYAAPEQYTGRTSPKTDVYQLGLVVWEVFAGYHSYRDKTTRQSIMYAQLEQIPPALATVVEGCPRPLSKIVEGMLDKDPRRRPTMDVVAMTLRDLEGDTSLSGRTIRCGRKAPWDDAGPEEPPLPSEAARSNATPSPVGVAPISPATPAEPRARITPARGGAEGADEALAATLLAPVPAAPLPTRSVVERAPSLAEGRAESSEGARGDLRTERDTRAAEARERAWNEAHGAQDEDEGIQEPPPRGPIRRYGARFWVTMLVSLVVSLGLGLLAVYAVFRVVGFAGLPR